MSAALTPEQDAALDRVVAGVQGHMHGQVTALVNIARARLANVPELAPHAATSSVDMVVVALLAEAAMLAQERGTSLAELVSTLEGAVTSATARAARRAT